MTHTLVAAQPTVHLTVGRNRRRAYGPNEYRLRDGEEYELEIHNTTRGTVGARVRVEGRPIGQTLLVLRPGERVYLERWMDRPQRFRFSTYEVDGSPESQAATANNGRVTVEFFRENVFVPPPPQSPLWAATGPAYPGGSFYTVGVVGDSTTAINFMGLGGAQGPQGPEGFAGPLGSASYTCSVGQQTNSVKSRGLTKTTVDRTVVTGRTEAGSASAQSFTTVDLVFESWAFHTASLRVLPLLAEAASEARRYCTGCGTRAKKDSWRHCPNCGAAL